MFLNSHKLMLKWCIRVQALQKFFTSTIHSKLKLDIFVAELFTMLETYGTEQQKTKNTLPLPIQAFRIASRFFWRPNFVSIPITTKGLLLE